MAQNYKHTMNLPKTDFPMRASLAQREPERLKAWEDEDLYEQMLKKNEGNEARILHDGPPYANGPIHIGHAMNKLLKDFIVRYWNMKGYYAPYVPGWDCHGQPIEHKIESKLGTETFRKTPQPQIRELCREYADANVEIQRQGFKRLGVLGKWEDPYLTHKPYYEVADVEVFRKIYNTGAIYEGKKPVHWCHHCNTALAEAEIEYAPETSESIYVAFMLTEHPRAFASFDGDMAVVIWTTTPWTLPANAAVALNRDAAYVGVVYNNTIYLMAQDLVESAMKACDVSPDDYRLYQVDGQVVTVLGSELEGLTYLQPIHEGMTCPIILGNHVELTDGTGCVHTAPGHGMEDYEVALEYGLPIPMPVDDLGFYNEGGGRFAGMHIDDANLKIIDYLAEMKTLLGHVKIEHSYPHCWRCKNPVIFRATKQWFVSMDTTDLRARALECVRNQVTWYPAWAVNRIGSMVEDRPDWCISRQRSWGVPIPVFHCKQCGEVVANDATFDAVIDLFKREGADAWFTTDPKTYLPEDTACSRCGCHEVVPETDILDVWWESGVSYTAVCDHYEELHQPVDVYLEGSDQHRGWFQSSLLTSVASEGRAPYKSVISCGFINDEHGKKMSKSIGNVVDPNEVAATRGAEIIRLWVASTDSSRDVQISDNILSRTSDAYRQLRNTFRFLLSNLADFNPKTDAVPLEDLLPLDRFELARMECVHAKVEEAYASYKFHTVYRTLYDYVNQLSSTYLDATKDRLYANAPRDRARLSALTAMAQIFSMLVRDLAPILAFTTDEVLEYAPASLFDGVKRAALLSWYQPCMKLDDAQAMHAIYQLALSARDCVTKALEEAKSSGGFGKSQEARITCTLPTFAYDQLTNARLDLAELFVVSEVVLKHHDTALDERGILDLSNTQVVVERAHGEKCPRCWNYRTLGVDADYPDVCERCAQVLHQAE